MMSQDIRYTYAVGRIRVLETRLLNKQAYERLIESETLNELIFILKEYNLSQDFRENMKVGYRILDELSLDKWLVDFFRLKYDFHNLKIILKSKFLGMEESDLSDLGILEPSLVRRIVNGESIQNYPFDYRDIFDRAGYIFSQSLRAEMKLQLLNFTIDKFKIDHLYGLLKNEAFLKDYFKRYIDLENICFYFRLKQKKDILEEALFDDGYINRRQFFGELDLRELSRYEKIIGQGIEYQKRENDLSFFEKLCDDYLLGFLKPAKYVPFGIEPLFGYIIALEYQARSIHAVLFSKRNEIPNDFIRQNLRESYV